MSTLEELLAEMSTLEDQIKDVEGEIKACSDPKEKEQLRKKEEQLRKKEEQLREKELILLRSQQAAGNFDIHILFWMNLFGNLLFPS
jgi:hypothetical protein